MTSDAMTDSDVRNTAAAIRNGISFGLPSNATRALMDALTPEGAEPDRAAILDTLSTLDSVDSLSTLPDPAREIFEQIFAALPRHSS